MKLINSVVLLFILASISCSANNKVDKDGYIEMNDVSSDTLMKSNRIQLNEKKCDEELFLEMFKGKSTFYVESLGMYDTSEVIKIKSQTGTITFRSASNTEDGVVYEFAGENATNSFSVVKANLYEGSEYYLVDQVSGNIDTIWNAPLFNEASNMLVCKSLDFGLEGRPNGFQVFKFNQKSRTWKKLLEIEDMESVPVEIAWVSENRIIIRSVSFSNYELGNQNYNYSCYEW